MQRTILLDTSFLSWLDKFDRYCRTNGYFHGLSRDKMPVEALDFLLAKGCNLVIPNEVLKEITDGKRGRIGMGMADDAPYLDYHLIEDSFDPSRGNTNVRAWLQEKLLDHRVDYYGDADAFWKYAQGPKAAGRIAFVAYTQPPDGDGFEPHNKRDRNLEGDDEIEILYATAPENSHPQLLLSNDHGLNDRARAACPATINVNGYSFLEMIALTGFVDDFALFPKLVQSMNKNDAKGALPQPSGRTHRLMSDAVAEWGLHRFRTADGQRQTGFAQTEQDRQLHAAQKRIERG